MALPEDNEVLIKTKEMYQPYNNVISNYDHFKRPPIKFIAMIIKAVCAKTKFGSGYFTADQLAGKLNTKEEKLDFLKMLHIYTEYVNKKHFKVDPAKIAAGQEVENTLMLLQAVYQGSENPKMDFETAGKRAMKKFESEKDKPKEEKKDDKAKEKPKEEKKEEKPKEKPKEEKPKEKPKEEKPKEEKKEEKPKEEKKERKEKPKEEKPKEEKKEEKPKEKPKEEKPKEEKPKERKERPKKAEPEVPAIQIDVEDDTAAARPMTARKAPPKIKEEAPVILESKVTTIIKEADVEDEADDVFVEETAGGAATNSEDNGILVKKILEKYQDVSQNQQTDTYDSDRFKQSIEFAKGLLQHLARSATPLDQLIQFSQEDLGNMENEYARWTEECKRQEKALEQEKATTETILHDLNSKVEDLDKDISRQENKLRAIKHAALLKEAELMKDFAALCAN